MTWQKHCSGLIADERGFTTVGAVLALLITLSLVFSAAQVCRLNAVSSEVQSVADAAALAAENEVAEFMIVVRTCDAVVLTLSLTSAAATGLGVAALCTPATAGFSEPLLSAAKEVARARTTFAEKASTGLDRLQRLLPFLAAANAASVAVANNRGASSYAALAVLAPATGEELVVEADDESADLERDVDENADDLAREARKAEEAAQEANRAKARGFEHDCGANPSYCMYERAGTLAGMVGSANPLYSSVDAWSFSIALKRAQAYYPRRLAQESPEDSSVAEQVRSALRTRFYAFAADEVALGYVHETDDSFEAFFPPLPKNTDEMRGTRLYTEAVYPVTVDSDGASTMHAWSGCPEAASASGAGSIAQMEAGSYTTCPLCAFDAASMGKVAAASTSIDNGFEYHYNAVAEAADAYEKARSELDPVSASVKKRAGTLLDRVGEVLGAAANARIDARPPGGRGVVVLAVNTASQPASAGFESSLVRSSGALGTRAAVAAATLLAEPANEGATVISSLLDGIADEGGAAVGALGIVLDCWSSLLSAYTDGQKALDGAVADGLDGLPLASASGLGTWAAGALRKAVSAVGLEPVELDALKPVLVNAAHVAEADDGAFSARLLSLKRQAIANPLSSTDAFSSVVGSVEQAIVGGIEAFDGKIEIARIELLGEGGPSVPLEVSLPPAAKELASGFVEDVANALRSAYAQVSGVVAWG